MPEPGRDTIALMVVESSQAGEARRLTLALARTVAFDEVSQGKVALIVTELANNLVRHASQGELIVRTIHAGGQAGLEVLSIDRGPGVADFCRCLVDGFSTAGTPGNGLGAVVRMCDEFDVYSAPNEGTVISARVMQTRRPLQARPKLDYSLNFGAVCLPLAGEVECGDAWAYEEPGSGISSLIVADGLGHGPKAAEASRGAVDLFHQNPSYSPSEHLQAIHPALKGTRGAAVAVAVIDRNRREIRYAGVGNIAGTVFDGAGQRRGLVSHNGTVGGTMHKTQEFTLPWPEGALLVMHSDGLGTQWRLDNRLALKASSPGVIAGVLYRDFTRGRDDVTVVVARDEGPTG